MINDRSATWQHLCYLERITPYFKYRNEVLCSIFLRCPNQLFAKDAGKPASLYDRSVWVWVVPTALDCVVKINCNMRHSDDSKGMYLSPRRDTLFPLLTFSVLSEQKLRYAGSAFKSVGSYGWLAAEGQTHAPPVSEAAHILMRAPTDRASSHSFAGHSQRTVSVSH